MINWNEIDNKIFEDLAYDYISDKYPELNWEKTGLTRDGNKDGYATLNHLPMGVTVKYWYEAKFSINTKNSIPKSHLDSTLVSSVLDGSVRVIAFITNAYISEDYKRRADIFAKQKNSIIVYYINGQEIENWLSDNLTIEHKYFNKITSKKNEVGEKIIDAAIFSQYNSGAKFTVLKTVETDKEYVLFISFYTPHTKQIYVTFTKNIMPLEVYGREYDDYRQINTMSGYNRFYIPIKIVSKSSNDLGFSIHANEKIYSYTFNTIKVLSVFNPTIYYKEQERIIFEIHNFIKDRDITNSIYCIWGGAGYGKSTLIEKLISSHVNPYNNLLIKFTGEENFDIILCYKLVIYIIHGAIWEFEVENNAIDAEPILIRMLAEISSKSPNTETLDCISEAQHTKNISSDLLQDQVFIDDFYKISSKVIKFFEWFFEWFVTLDTNKKLFIFSRELDEDKNKLLTIINNKACYKTKINEITANDTYETMRLNFPEMKSLHSVIRQYKTPMNTLFLVNVISSIDSNKQKWVGFNQVEVQLKYHDLLQVLNNVSGVSYATQIMNKFSASKVVYCIYHIKYGISIDALVGFWGEQIYDDIHYLCGCKIIKDEGGLLMPYHDIYLKVYLSQEHSKSNSEFEDFIQFCYNERYLERFFVLSILLSLGPTKIYKYKNEAIVYRNLLHKQANYYQAYIISVALSENTQNSIDTYHLTDLENIFVQANCLKYIKSYEESNRKFEEIVSFYNSKKDETYRGVYLEAQTEIINNYIWMLQINKATQRLEEIKHDIETISSNNNTKPFVYAYLNYYNRFMFINYILDNMNISYYDTAYQKSKVFNVHAYEGFAKMDYAKNLYIINIDEAYNYLLQAKKIFEKTGEKRRLLDVTSELIYLEEIRMSTYSYDKLFEIKKEMQLNYYTQSSIKVELKSILLMLLSGCPVRIVQEKLNMLLNKNSSIDSGKRHQAFIYHLFAATHYLEGKLRESSVYSTKCLNLFNELGESYKVIQMHNRNIKTIGDLKVYNKYMSRQCSDFILDIRIW